MSIRDSSSCWCVYRIVQLRPEAYDPRTGVVLLHGDNFMKSHLRSTYTFRLIGMLTLLMFFTKQTFPPGTIPVRFLACGANHCLGTAVDGTSYLLEKSSGKGA